ncbi:MAG: lysophospholipid acyltransferase family protein [Methylophilaceae bacterium]
MSDLSFRIARFLLTLLAYIPLFINHALGALLGWLVFFGSPSYARRIRKNIEQSHITQNEKSLYQLIQSNVAESGKTVIETFAIWFRRDKSVFNLVKACYGWEHVEIALKHGKGLIFLTPHLGCFEITSLYYGAQHPMTVLYRQPRHAWLLPLITSGRQRSGVTLAPANATGIKQLLQTLKRGEAIGILPDQAPFEGEGVWAPFFERPAYTMTLASKLAEKTGAQVFMAFGERLSFGRGYHIHIRPIEAGGINTPDLLNAEIETTIRQCPAQYLWGYDRYKDRHQTLPANHL